MPAARPKIRPAERSVPVSTIQPPMPSAMGSDTAASVMMFTMELGLTKFLLTMAVKMIKMAMRMYSALFSRPSTQKRRLSRLSSA